ncbi:MAG: hypothetical protein QM809_16035 [Gordonia sp. (in: high G+C Gram-positive bacteria)]|uniref:hypothetical protein n=1 Tax=Gordonia sp. (in: high G+C Gram-positive bacteria) TaxID=84139 RepID=UPI0039E710ED
MVQSVGEGARERRSLIASMMARRTPFSWSRSMDSSAGPRTPFFSFSSPSVVGGCGGRVSVRRYAVNTLTITWVWSGRPTLSQSSARAAKA